MLLKRLVSVIWMTGLLILPAFAQTPRPTPLSVENGNLVLLALDQQLALPLPDWLELDGAGPDAILDRMSVQFSEDASEARLELYPRGEGEALWTRLYGARLFRQPNLSLTDLRSVIINVYARACRPDAVALFQLEPDNGEDIPPLGFVCGAYLDLPGYAGQGEVMLARFVRSETGAAMVYQEWRGAAFDTADPASWPISAAQIEQRVEEFKSAAGIIAAD
ncbi:hypothetical protein [Devosia chinhatensis]|uniref:Uncharacterized protein n=1 Tax=Devosia chinhatensis TaxID=429727 RepID=A0A0F5FGH0_9HYPH|nr:hypothetical protein [Devosia chinhatensis]KKB07951.1 hypothetical protein VE26_15180 [Devosia chinhatensis]